MSTTEKGESVNHSDIDPVDVIVGAQCNCGVRDAYDHRVDCALWDVWEYDQGYASWNADAGVLVWDVPSSLPLVDVDKLDSPIVATAPTTAPTATSSPTVAGDTYWSQWATDRHYQDPVILPDGTTVYASSQHSDRQTDPIPDLGIYLDGSWRPDTIAFHVGCPDYGIPTPAPWQVLHIAREGIRVAQSGQRVEIGCIGGHGRTGLMLAIMVLLTSKKPNGRRAVSYVRKHYCNRAVESKVQEWYVSGMAAELKGRPWPPKPTPPPIKKWATVPAAVPTIAPPLTITPTTSGPVISTLTPAERADVVADLVTQLKAPFKGKGKGTKTPRDGD